MIPAINADRTPIDLDTTPSYHEYVSTTIGLADERPTSCLLLLGEQ
jgi:hypothetical protein